MKQADALAQLKSMEPELRDQGVLSLYLFGSVARDEAADASDIDLFFDAAEHLSLLDVIGVKHFLEDNLAATVDVMTRGSIHPYLKQRIEQSAIQVF